MPSIKNPGLLSPGAGVLPPKTVPNAALITPDRDMAALKAHINDPNRAHMASAIGIVDAGGYFTSDEVEGVLQEIGSGAAASAGRQNGFFIGGTFTTAGRVVTLDAGSKILANGAVRDVSGESVTCPIIAGAYYVYFDGTSGALTAATALPDLADEPIWVAEVTHDGTNVTSSRDARFFVANLDRKLDYTARADAGTATDNEAEACFVTLEAAFFWMEVYGGTQDIKRTLIVRGAHTVTSAIFVSWDNLEIRGEGGASITFDSADQQLLTISANESLIFRDLMFICNSTDPAPQALFITAANKDFLIERCHFVSGSTDWSLPINCSGLATRLTIRGGTFVTIDEAIFLFAPEQSLIENVTITGPGASTAFSRGIAFYDIFGLNPASNNRIVGIRVYGVDTGIYFAGIGTGTVVADCYIEDAKTGISVGTDSGGFQITGTSISLDTTVGLTGVSISSSDGVVSNCVITNPRAYNSYAATSPFGVQITGATATNTRVVGCRIAGFVTEGSGGCAGVYFDGQMGTPTGVVEACALVDCGVRVYRTSDVVVSGNRLSIDYAFGSPFVGTSMIWLEEAIGATVSSNIMSCGGSDGFAYGVVVRNSERITVSGNQVTDCIAGIWATDANRDVSISGNSITGMFNAAGMAIIVEDAASSIGITSNVVDGYLPATPFAPEATGICIRESSGNAPEGIIVAGNTVTRCTSGIVLQGTAGTLIQTVTVSGNSISQCAYAVAPANTFGGWGSKGIGMSYVKDALVCSNMIKDIGAISNNAGTYGIPTGCVSATGIGVYRSGGVKISDNAISALYTQDDGGDVGTYRGIRWSMVPAGTETVGAIVSGNLITPTPSSILGTNNGFAGVHAYVDAGLVLASTAYGINISGNTIEAQTADLTYGVLLESPNSMTAFSGLSISRNVIRNAEHGVVFQNDSTYSTYRMSINENTLYATSNGILVGSSWYPPTASFDMHQSEICRNRIVVENLVSAVEHGLLLVSQTAESCVVQDNSISVTQTGAAKKILGLVCTSAITSTLQPYTAKNIRVDSNKLRFNSSDNGVYVEAATAQNISVSNNSVVLDNNNKDCSALRVSLIKEKYLLGTPSSNEGVVVDRNSISGTISQDGSTMLWLQVGGDLNGGSASQNCVAMESDTTLPGPTSITVKGVVVCGINSAATLAPTWSNTSVDTNSVRIATPALDTGVTPVYPNNGALVIDLYNVGTAVWTVAQNLSVSGNKLASNAVTATVGSGLFIGHNAATGNAWQVCGNSSIGFAATECGRMISTSGGSEPTNSVCCNNIAQDGAVPAAGAGFSWGFDVNTNNWSF